MPRNQNANLIDLRSVSNQELFRRFKSSVAEERRATLEVLKLFRETERRMFFAELGYSSLLDFAVRELGYSEPAAYRRISAMRILHELPETAEKISSGELNLTTMSKAASFFRKRGQAGKKLALDEKRDILNSLVHLSARNAERVLVDINPELFPATRESRRALADGGVQISTSLQKETVQHLEEIQDLLGKTMSFSELFAFMAKQQVQSLRKTYGVQKPVPAKSDEVQDPSAWRDATPPAKSDRFTSNVVSCDPKPRKKSVEMRTITEEAKPIGDKIVPSRYIPAKIRKAIQKRSASRCEWVNPNTNRRCEGKRYLQIDHLNPFALGGKNTIQNLQFVCQAHNQLRAMQTFGPRKISKYVRSIRSTVQS